MGLKDPPLCIDSNFEVVELTLATKIIDVLHLAHRAQLSILSKLKIQKDNIPKEDRKPHAPRGFSYPSLTAP